MNVPEIRDRSEYKRNMNALLEIDPARTVVLTIDMQRDYLDLEVGTSTVTPEDAKRVLSRTAELLELARTHGIPIIHVYMVRRPIEVETGVYPLGAYGKASRQAKLSQNATRPARPRVTRVDGAPDAEIPGELVAPTDIHVRSKRVSDSYHNTELDTLLQRVFKPEVVVHTGINTDTCVYATTFGTSVRGYRPVVISDCVASTRGQDHHWMALELMSRSISWVLTVEGFREKIAGKQLDDASDEALVGGSGR